MKKIQLTDKAKTNLMIFGVSFLAFFVVYCGFLNHSFTSDHVRGYMRDYEITRPVSPLNLWYYIKSMMFIQVFIVWINYFFSLVDITKDINQYVFQLLVMLFMAYGTSMLYSLYQEFFSEKKKKTALLILLWISFINPYFCEVFLYVGYDKMIAVIFAIWGTVLFAKKRYILSFLCVMISLTGYQVNYVFFLAYTGTWIFLSYKDSMNLQMLKKYMGMYMVMVIPGVIIVAAGILYTKFGIGTYFGKMIPVDVGLARRLFSFRKKWKEIMCTQQGLLPSNFLAFCFLLTGLASVGLAVKKGIKDVLYCALRILCLSIYPVTLFLVAVNYHASGRIIWCVFAALSAAAITVLALLDDGIWKNRIAGGCLALFYMINIFCVSSTITNIYKSNALDIQIVSQVVAQIENYEQNTGISVTKISAAANKNAKFSYPQVGLLGKDYSNGDAGYYNFTHKTMNDVWADDELFIYLTKRPYEIVYMPEEIWEEHFAGRSWETFNPQEQLYFEGDTLYWCIY